MDDGKHIDDEQWEDMLSAADAAIDAEREG